jgi:hypothetical protein
MWGKHSECMGNLLDYKSHGRTTVHSLRLRKTARVVSVCACWRKVDFGFSFLPNNYNFQSFKPVPREQSYNLKNSCH